MKKIIFSLITISLISIVALVFPVSSFGEEQQPPLLTDLKYDETTRVLSGKSIPNANISLSDVVGIIVADETGYFEMPIPDDIQKSTITVMDFIQEKSTDVDYDFTDGATANGNKATQKNNSPSKKNKTSVSQNKNAALASTSQLIEKEEALTEKKPLSIIPWVIILVALVVLALLVIFVFYAKNETEKQLEIAEQNMLKRKRRRRRRPTAD